ncbi:hypothetical protein Mth01_40800 [Sphaerimonospora thailandensis]|uniref:GH64 domain-containing protein n=1 Tax=Sphaerimonospora thailandensis TaxID=795644 RepID=A0A8J3R9X4_9ACTN|nr:hypothetical protein Mth01_40800 [Sphaerimonospora thailandensis]
MAAIVVASPVVTVASPAQAAAGPDLLPVTITNNTGRNEPVYLYVLGQDIRPGGRLGYVNRGGAFSTWPAGSLPPSPAPDVSIPGPGNGGSTTIHVPRFLSGRVYFSFGEKLRLFVTPDGLVQPAPWAGGDPNRDVLFDWSELTYNDAGLWINSTQVDQFAVPHAVSVTGGDGVTKRTGELVGNGRQNVINGLKGQPGWEKTVHTRGDGTVLRVLSPGKAADAGLLDRSYLDPYITSAWNAYTGKTLTIVPFRDQPNIKYFGRTSGNVLNFTDGSGRQVHSIRKPSTADVWGCSGALFAPNDNVAGPIARTVCAALQRSTLGTMDTQPSYDPADFYRGSLTNHYSRVIHANMVDGKAYGFPFDDVGNFESLVHDGNPRSAGITLTPFGAGGPPDSGIPLNKPVSLRVTTPGFTDRYLRHQNGLARTDVIDGGSADVAKADATFWVRPGLADSSCVSFESRNFPGDYLRHSDYRLRKDRRDGSALFAADATFCPHKVAGGTALESYNYRGHYIRHYNASVYIAKRGGPRPYDTPTRYAEDTSWAIAQPWAP